MFVIRHSSCSIHPSQIKLEKLKGTWLYNKSLDKVCDVVDCNNRAAEVIEPNAQRELADMTENLIQALLKQR
jgi:hypothetical protein